MIILNFTSFVKNATSVPKKFFDFLKTKILIKTIIIVEQKFFSIITQCVNDSVWFPYTSVGGESVH